MHTNNAIPHHDEPPFVLAGEGVYEHLAQVARRPGEAFVVQQVFKPLRILAANGQGRAGGSGLQIARNGGTKLVADEEQFALLLTLHLRQINVDAQHQAHAHEGHQQQHPQVRETPGANPLRTEPSTASHRRCHRPACRALRSSRPRCP